MILRSILLLCFAGPLVCVSPGLAAGTPTASDTTASAASAVPAPRVAAAGTETWQIDNAVVKKPRKAATKVAKTASAHQAPVSGPKGAKRDYSGKSELVPQVVEFSGYPAGTIVIDTGARYLYLVEGRSTARRYVIGVGKEGLEFKGKAKVGDKQEWPRWIPTGDMIRRSPLRYGWFAGGVDGGPDNPLGARAIYLYQGQLDTHVRIHGTNEPNSIGRAVSNGCFRMLNDNVIDLYNRVKVGTPVVVL